MLLFGSIVDPVLYPNPGAPILTPQEEFALDTKMDDGLPGLGNLRAQPPSSPYAPNCATDNDPVVARYNVAYTEVGCAFKEILN